MAPQDSSESQSDSQDRRSSWDDPSGSLGSRPRRNEPRSKREMLHVLADQYLAAQRRADDAERMLQELKIHLKTINDARLQALHDAAKANEELKLYKIQLRSAQNEIYKAQDIIEAVDRQRYNAEKEAAKFRSKARQDKETILTMAAREEAWRLGLQEGLNRGRGQTNEENRFAGFAGELEEHTLNDDDSFDETYISSPDVNTFPTHPPPFIPSLHNRPPSNTNPSLLSNPPTVAQSIHPPENIRPVSIRSEYTRPPSRQRATSSPTSLLPPSIRPPSSQSLHPSENVQPMSIRSAQTRPSSRQRVSPSPVLVPSKPASIRTATHTPGVVPPDNFIPSLDADNKIRIPPPFEFQRAVTPERPVSPQPLTMSDSSQEVLMVPGPHAKTPQQYRRRHHRRHSSSESNSSSFSNLDIINDRPPVGISTPMSVIPEVLSVQSIASQLPDGDHHSRHQRSFSGNSTYTPNVEAQTRFRPHSRSSYAASTRNAPRQGESGHSGNSSPPNISVRPPSGGSSRNVTLSTVLGTHGLSSTSVPEGYHPAVDPSLSPAYSRRYSMNSYAANEGVSSSIGTGPLMTPPQGYVSAEPDWSGATASAAHVPLLPSSSLTELSSRGA